MVLKCWDKNCNIHFIKMDWGADLTKLLRSINYPIIINHNYLKY